MKTLPELFRKGVSRPRERHLRWRDRSRTWQGISTEEVVRDVGRLARSLHALGLRKGDRVALLSRNSPRWLMTDFGGLHAGLVTVPLYPTLSPEQVRFILDDCGARVLFLEDLAQHARLAGVLEGSKLERVVLLSDEEPPAGGAAPMISWTQLVERGSDAPPHGGCPGPEDLASIIYTSGTTGRPKGVMLTHWNLVSNALACAEAIDLTRVEHENLSMLPLSHVFQRLVDYLLFKVGAEMAYCPSPLEALDYMAEARPTFFASVPRLYEKVRSGFMAKLPPSGAGRRAADWALEVGRRRFHAWYRDGACDGKPSAWLGLQHAIADRLVLRKVRAVFGGNVDSCFSGGAPMSREVHEFFCSVGLPVLPGYGLTETSPVLCTNSHSRMKLGSVGPALPGVELRVAADGELLARGPNIMQGYFGLPEETAAVLVDGWLHTGDLARIDEAGYVFITGRKKEIIVLTTGKKVAPAMVEDRLSRSPYVSQSVVVGDERKFIAALVAPNMDALAAEAARRGWAKSSAAELLAMPETKALVLESLEKACSDLADFERVKTIAFLPRELSMAEDELTPTLKVKRKVVLANWKGLVDSLYGGKSAA